MEVDLSSIYSSNVIILYCIFIFLLITGRSIIKFSLRPFSENNIYLRGFAYLFTGTVFLVLIYSVFITHFKTVNLAFILLFLFVFVEIRKHHLTGHRKFSALLFSKKDIPKEDRGFMIFLLLLPALLCLWQVGSMAHGNYIPFMSKEWSDNIYFAKLSEYLNTTGQENTFLFGSLFSDNLKGGTPYHYFELWINACIVKCSGTNPVYSLILVTRPLLLFMLACGMLAVAQFFLTGEKRILISVLIKSMALLFLFFTEINWHAVFKNDYFRFTIEPAVGIMWISYQKTVVVRVLIVLFFLCVLHRKYGLGIIALLFIPVCYSTVTMVLLSGLFLSLPVMLFMKTISAKEFFRFLFYTVFIGVFCYTWYHYFGNHIFIQSMNEASETYPVYFSDKGYLADAFYFFKMVPIATCAGFLPWIILLITGKSGIKEGRNIADQGKIFFLFTSAFFITGLMGWSLLRFLFGVNSSQLFYTLFIPFASLLFLFLFVSLTKRNVLTLSLLLIIFIALICFNFTKTRNGYYSEVSSSYSKQYIDSTYQLYRQHPEKPVVFLSDSVIYSESSSNKSSLAMPLKHFAFFSCKENQVNIDVFNIPRETVFTQQNQTAAYLKTSVFYQYCERQRSEGRFISPEKGQIDFIKEHQVKYLQVTQKSIITPELETYFDKIIEDSNTGNRFIVLKLKN